MQVQGGVGFIEETGACQYHRDSRITTIYEGTTGIQANDLIGRNRPAKSPRRGDEISTAPTCAEATVGEFGDHPDLRDRGSPARCHPGPGRGRGVGACQLRRQPTQAAAAGAVPFLKLTGIVTGGWLMARSALLAAGHLAQGQQDDFYVGQIATATYFATHQLPFARAYAAEVITASPPGLAESLF